MATFRFGLLLYLSLALAVVATDTFSHHRRDHGDLARLVKKRSPLDILGNQPTPQGQQPSTDGFDVEPSQQATGQTSTASTSSAPASASSSNGGDDLLSSLLGGVGPTSSGTSSSTAHTHTTSATSSSSSVPPTSIHTINSPATTPSQSILYITSSSSIPTPTQTSATSSSTGMSHAAMTVLVIIATSVGASVIVWTIIRKWKFRPSSDFGSRMQPIDWQPGGADDAGQRRPLSRASSFHSGSANGHVDDHMRGPVGGYGTTALNPIPDHDFTAGPAHLAPVGGYADLARGPSPQPMMQESLTRAPTINRPVQYDQQGVPLYHGYTGY